MNFSQTIDERNDEWNIRWFQLELRIHSVAFKFETRSFVGNESESLNFQESSANISMGNQRRINIIQLLRSCKAVMQEGEIFRMNERNPQPETYRNYSISW